MKVLSNEIDRYCSATYNVLLQTRLHDTKEDSLSASAAAGDDLPISGVLDAPDLVVIDEELGVVLVVFGTKRHSGVLTQRVFEFFIERTSLRSFGHCRGSHLEVSRSADNCGEGLASTQSRREVWLQSAVGSRVTTNEFRGSELAVVFEGLHNCDGVARRERGADAVPDVTPRCSRPGQGGRVSTIARDTCLSLDFRHRRTKHCLQKSLMEPVGGMPCRERQ